MRHQELTRQFFIKTRKKLVEKLEEGAMVLFFSNPKAMRNSDQQYIYRQSSNMLYFTGIAQAETVLLLYVTSDGVYEVLFIERPDPKTAIWEGHQYSLAEASEQSGITDVRYNDTMNSTLEKIAQKSTSLYVSHPEHHHTANQWVEHLLKESGNLEQKDINPQINALRAIKQPEEITLIKKAVDITGQAFYQLLKRVKPGVWEYQVEAEIMHAFIGNGADAHAFDPIVASGKNNCVLHYIQNNRKMQNGELLLLDFGPEYNGYAADMSRTIPVNGLYSQRQRDVYNAVLDAQKKAIELIRPGISIKEINKKVRSLMEEKMVELGLFSQTDIDKQDPDNPISRQYFMHGTSHFMGLDVHDVGDVEAPLEPGMVLTCEPGLYIRQETLGVRIENDILVTDTGNIDLMQHIPRKANEIEDLMRQHH